MVRVVATLAGIFLAAYLAVHLGYARLEKELLGRSCCGIAGLPTPEAGQQGAGKLQGLPSTSSASKAQNTAQSTTKSLVTEPIRKSNLDFQIIVRRNIFQLIQEEEPVTPEKISPPPVEETAATPTKLNLTLLGTVQGDEQGSRAIIAEKNEQKLYRVGDAVQGAIIESIERGQVILDVFGTRETLTMKKREGGGPGLPSTTTRGPRLASPARRVPQDIKDEDIEEHEELDDLDEDEENEEANEGVAKKKVKSRRRPPSIRPHRRINFRRNPIRNAPDMDVDMPMEDLMDEEEDIPLDQDELPEEE